MTGFRDWKMVRSWEELEIEWGSKRLKTKGIRELEELHLSSTPLITTVRYPMTGGQGVKNDKVGKW